MKNELRGAWKKFQAGAARAHTSLTIWFNSLMGALVVGLPYAQDSLPQLQEYLPANLYHDLMGALVVGNILLRFKTDRALADK
jgi:hypothetical protein